MQLEQRVFRAHSILRCLGIIVVRESIVVAVRAAMRWGGQTRLSSLPVSTRHYATGMILARKWSEVIHQGSESRFSPARSLSNKCKKTVLFQFLADRIKSENRVGRAISDVEFERRSMQQSVQLMRRSATSRCLNSLPHLGFV